jgi:hypothetical protein
MHWCRTSSQDHVVIILKEWILLGGILLFSPRMAWLQEVSRSFFVLCLPSTHSDPTQYFTKMPKREVFAAMFLNNVEIWSSKISSNQKYKNKLLR